MRVLITGAGGNLGRSLIPALVAAGHTPRLMDFRPLETPSEFVQGDVRNPQDVKEAVSGVEAIVHSAALHGIHLRKWAPQDFWAINATGTFNVFEAAREAGITRMVLCSTMSVYGESARPPDGAWGAVTEALPALPGDVYGLSKKISEEIAQNYSRRCGMTTIALRLGMFVPETW
jgi:UDP-glucose 4-epimerase